MEAEKCIAQSEKINDEKVEFENAIYAKVRTLSYLTLFSYHYIWRHYFIYLSFSMYYLILPSDFQA